MTMVGLDEKKSAPTSGYFSPPGSVITKTGQHIAGIQFRCDSYSGSTTSTDPHLTSETVHAWIGVEHGTELCVAPGSTLVNKTPPATTVDGLDPGAGNTFDVETSSDPSTGGVISSGHVLVYWTGAYTTYHYDNAPDSDGPPTWVQFKYELDKLSCDDASVTTRRTYGQPNTGGEYPADPNAPLRYVKYGAWDFKGGNFVGNMPDGGSDSSGTARVDLFVNGASGTTTYSLAALSLFDEGKPSTTGLSGAIDLGVFVPTSVTSGITESNVTWDTQFAFTAGSPYKDLTLTDGNSNDYIVIQTPASGTALTNLTLALKDESSVISANTVCWHYFASKNFQRGTTFPNDDCAPRVWVTFVVP